MAYADLEVYEIRDSLIRGKTQVSEILPRLRELLKRKVQNESTNKATTPALSFEDSDDEGGEDSLETLFAYAIWEGPDKVDPSDLQLLEKCIMETTKGSIPFRVGAAWLALKCRPGATRDEVNDAQQLLDRYLTQIAREAPPSAEMSNKLRTKYAYLVELLTIRVLPTLNLLESAQSFLAKEHVRADLLLESDRERLVEQLKVLSPKPSTKSPAAAASAPAQQQEAPSSAMAPISAQPAAAPPSADAQQMVAEFERRRRLAQEEEQLLMIRTVAVSATAVLIVSLVFSERKRISKFFSTLGDALFGD